MTTRLNLFFKQGKNVFQFGDTYLRVKEGSTITLTNLIAFWPFENITSDETITLTDDKGAVTNLLFGEGYWTFEDNANHLSKEGIILTPRPHNNSCGITSDQHTINLGNIGPLIGFQRNTTIQRASTKDSGTVSVNQGIRFISISCDIVDNSRNFDNVGNRSFVIARLPVDTSSRLNGD